MSNDLLREALQIGLDNTRIYAADYHLKYRGHYQKVHKEVDDDVRKIEAAIAALDMYATATHAENVSTNGENSDTSPAFDQTEFDTMVEKGTKAWAGHPMSDFRLDWGRVNDAAQVANNQFGQWMPERWMQLFVAAYDAEAKP